MLDRVALYRRQDFPRFLPTQLRLIDLLHVLIEDRLIIWGLLLGRQTGIVALYRV
jgi:hypothetical protein